MKNLWRLLPVPIMLMAGLARTENPAAAPKPAVADNSRCHVCHGNYQDEPFAVRHAKASIGCEKCHGPSDDHAGDEDNITPPDIMFGSDKINPACLKCHAAAKMAEAKDHKPVWAEIAAGGKRCTECHGTHRLARRSVRWDKTTREVLPKN